MHSKSLISKIGLLVIIGLMVTVPMISFAQLQQPTTFGAPTAAQKAAQTPPAVPQATKDAACPGDWITCGLMSAFQWIIVLVTTVITGLAAWLITLATSIIQMIINAGAKVMESPLATTGFKISLDIANLGFVLAIIAIAYTTIFRVAGYEAKKLLRNLIIAALLVNFSFTIAGLIIDFGNVFGNFFLNAASGGDISHFSDNLANAFNIQSLSAIKPDQATSLSILTVGAGFFNIFISAAAVLIFNVVLVITFFALAFMLVLRYIWITLLLIIMPLAWLAWIFPGFSHYFGEWWKNFLRWSLFYPAVTLFLYFAIITADKVGDVVKTSAGSAGPGQSSASLAGFGQSTMVSLLQIIVQVAIAFGGLFAANSLGIKGADQALGMAKGVKNWAIGAAGRATGVPRATRALGGAAAKGAVGTMNAVTASKTWKKTADLFSKVPGLRNTSATMYDMADNRKRAVEARKEEMGKGSKDAIMAKARAAIGPVDKAAYANILAEKGMSDDYAKKYGDDELNVLLKAAGDTGTSKGILEKRVDYAARVKGVDERKPENKEQAQKLISEAVEKMTEKQMADQDPAALANAMVFEAMDEAQLTSTLKKASVSKLKKMGDAVAKLAKTNPDHPKVQFVIQNPRARTALKQHDELKFMFLKEQANKERAGKKEELTFKPEIKRTPGGSTPARF